MGAREQRKIHGPPGAVSFRGACPDDVGGIVEVFRSNRDDLSLFQQSEREVLSNIDCSVIAPLPNERGAERNPEEG